jgi:hypothetical protein
MSGWLQTPGSSLVEGGHTILRNVGSHKIYTVLHPRIRHSSFPEMPGSFIKKIVVEIIRFCFSFSFPFKLQSVIFNEKKKKTWRLS